MFNNFLKAEPEAVGFDRRNPVPNTYSYYKCHRKLARQLLCVCAMSAPNIISCRGTGGVVVGVGKGAPRYFEAAQGRARALSPVPAQALPCAGCLHGKCSVY